MKRLASASALPGQRNGAGQGRRALAKSPVPFESSTAFFEVAPVAFVIFDERGLVQRMNDAAARLLGVSAARLVGMPFAVAVTPSDIQSFLTHLQRCRLGAEYAVTTKLRVRNGLRVELVTTRPAKSDGRDFITALISLSEQEASESGLREAKQFAENLFEFVPQPLLALNQAFIIQATNSALRLKFECTARDLDGRALEMLEVVQWDDEEKLFGALRRLSSRPPKSSEIVAVCRLRPSGKKLAFLVHACRLAPEPGGQPLIVVGLEDITARDRQVELQQRLLVEVQELNATLERRIAIRTARLVAMNKELQAMSRKLINAQEAERSRLALELHDEIGQALTGLNMLLHRKTPDLAARELELQEARKVVGELLQRVRGMSIDLRPHALDDLGLYAAMSSYIKQFSNRAGIEVVFDCKPFGPNGVPGEIAMTAFRITQEALTNIARHAGATRVHVTVKLDEKALAINVEDNGKGFDAAKAEAGSSGLAGMRERARAAGGELRLETAICRGTRVHVLLPVTPKKGKPNDYNIRG